MIRLFFTVITFTLLLSSVALAQEVRAVAPFSKVIISPHIQVTLVEGEEESVSIESNTEDEEKLNIEVNGKTLRIYLDDAKETTKTQIELKNGIEFKGPVYKGTIVTATITYKTLNDISVRGEERLVCESLLKGENFRLKIYGASQVYLNEVDLKRFHTTIYGESTLEIKSGAIQQQKYTSYGVSDVDALAIANEDTRIIAYGEAELKINASKRIKITAYGAASLKYKGDAEIVKGVNIGETRIKKID